MITIDSFKKVIGSFASPEKEVSLKLFFDNLRNYLICGAIFYGVFKLFFLLKQVDSENSVEKLMDFDVPYILIISTFIILFLVGAIFLILNICQTKELVIKLNNNAQAWVDSKFSDLEIQKTIKSIISLCLNFYAIILVYCIMSIGFILVTMPKCT